MKRALLAAVIVALCAPAFAQELADLPAFYEMETIKVNYEFFSGFRLSLGGRGSGISMGISPFMREALSAYPDSAEYLRKYSWENLAGNVMTWGGLVATMVMESISLTWLTSGDTDLIKWYLENSMTFLSVSLGVEMVGSILLTLSYEDILNAVNAYNRLQVRGFAE